MINSQNLIDALPILIKDDFIFEQLKKEFPEILADIISFRDNPNCSCRGRVFRFFIEKLTKEPTILNKYVNDPNILNLELEKIKNQRQAENYSGRIIVIKKDEESWRQFAAEVQKKMFRSFCVVERESELAVYFL